MKKSAKTPGWYWVLVRTDNGFETWDRWHIAHVGSTSDDTTWHFWDGGFGTCFTWGDRGSAWIAILGWVGPLEEPEE
jgi:hypothetical protein